MSTRWALKVAGCCLAIRVAISAALSLAIVLFSVARPSEVRAQGAAPEVSVNAIFNLIAEGKNVDAVTQALDAARRTTADQRQFAFQIAAWTCVAVYDLECAKQALAISNDIIKQGPSESITEATYGYSLLVWSYIETMMTPGNASVRNAVGSRFPDRVVNPLHDPVLYADLQILAARRAVNEGKLNDARAYLEKALASTLSIRFQHYDAPRLLVRITSVFIETFDVERALRILTHAEPMLQRVPNESLLHVEVLEAQGQLAATANLFEVAARNFQGALNVLQQVQMPQETFSFYQASLYNSLLGVEVARESVAGVKSTLEHHPLTAKKPEILKRGHFANASEFYFSIAEEFALLALGSKDESPWKELWAQPARWAGAQERILEAEQFTRAANGLSLLRKGEREPAAKILLEAGRERLRRLQSVYGASLFSAPIPYWTDRLLLQFALGATTLVNASPDYDFVLSAHALLVRNLQSMTDDVLSVLAVQESDAKRRVVQTYQSIEHQRTAWEREALELMTKRLWSGEKLEDKAIGDERIAILNTANEFIRSRADLRADIVGGASGNNVTAITTLKSVQSVLKPEEAAVLHLGVLGRVIRICIASDQVFITKDLIDVAALQKDAALMQMALTASHNPSATLDSQYPVQEAVRIKNLLFGGLNDCMSKHRRIYIVGLDPILVGIPPAALLDEVPLATKDGYDLKNAKWLVRKFSFVRVSSLGVLAATKVLGRNRNSSLDYLGIGDPKVKPSNTAAATGQMASREPKDARKLDLSGLPELPETAEEVQKVAALYPPNKARTLLGRGATEEAFRLQPLSEFDVIHFATHGLIKEELPGLSEPALIMTPDQMRDDLSDGVLSSTQIAALPLRARLVVLSACNSARYDALVFSRGIQGLSAAFAVAGVPSMVASLWPIESRTARDIVTGLFTTLRSSSNPSVADALAQSTRDLLDSKLPTALFHPRFWAAFVVIGDGEVDLSQVTDDSPRLLAPYVQVKLEERGELLSAGALGADFVVGGLGIWTGKKFPGVIERRKANGQVVWSTSDEKFFSPHVTTLRSEIVAGGFVLPTKQTGEQEESLAAVRMIDAGGKKKWDKVFDRQSKNGETAVSVHASNDGRIAVLLGDFGYGYTGRQSIRLVELDRQSNEVRRFTDLVSSDSTRYATGLVAGSPDSLLVALNRSAQIATGKGQTQVNALGMLEVCWDMDGAEITLLERQTWSVARKVQMPRFRLAQALPVQGGWIVIGEIRLPCRLDTKAAAFAIAGQQPPKVLWLDSTPFVTTAEGARLRGDILEVYGTSLRAVSIRDNTNVERKMSDYSNDDYAKLYASKRVGDEARLARELFAVRVDPNGREVSRDFLGAGLPIAPQGIVEGANSAGIYGTVGLRPLWISR